VRDRRFAEVVLGIATAIVLLTYLALALFATPAADDYCYAVRARVLGFLPAQAVLYQKWSGRYTGTLLLSALGVTDMERIYPLVADAALVLTCLAMLALVAVVAAERLGLGRTLLAAGVLTALYLAGLPDVAQAIYWASGSLTYQAGNVGLTFLAAVLIYRERHAHHWALRSALWIAGAALVMLVQGTNDLTMLLTTFVLGAGALCAFRARRGSVGFWTGLLVVALVAGVVSGLAPGNFARAAAEATGPRLRPQPLLAAVLFLPWTVLRAAYWLSSLGLWAATMLWLDTGLPSARARLYRHGRFDRRYLLVPAAALGAYLALSFLGFLVNRHPLPERAESVLWLFFLLAWFPSATILTHWLAGDGLARYAGRLRVPALLLLAVSLLGAPNNFEAFKDAYRGYRYYREMAERREVIRAAKASGQADVVVPSLSRPPRSLMATEVTTDPHNHRNACLAEYYGLRSIRLGSEAPGPSAIRPWFVGE
jgi:hypothetical protein